MRRVACAATAVAAWIAVKVLNHYGDEVLTVCEVS